MYIYISDRIGKNMPAVHSKTIAVPRSDLATPLARRIPPTHARDRDYVNTGHSSKLKQVNKRSQ